MVSVIGRVERVASMVTARHQGVCAPRQTSVTWDYLDVLDHSHEATLQDALRPLRGRWVRITIEEITGEGGGNG